MADAVWKTQDPSTAARISVYFDVLGLYVVVMSKELLQALSYFALSLFCAPLLVYGHRVAFLFRIARCVFAVLLSIALAVVVACAETLTGNALSWYSHLWLLLPLYALPALLTTLAVLGSADSITVGRVARDGDDDGDDDDDDDGSGGMEREAYLAQLDGIMASLTPWSLILALMTYYHVASAYIVLVWVLPVAVVNILLRMWQPGYKTTLCLHLLSCLPGTVIWLQYSYLLIQFFGPLMGRIGTAILPDVVMAVAMAVLTAFVALTPLSYLVAFSPSPKVFRYLLSLVVVAMIYTVTVEPYGVNQPKRLFLQHTQRERYHHQPQVTTFDGSVDDCLLGSTCTLRDSGMWSIGMDYHSLSPFAFHQKQVACQGIYCDLPWYFPIMHMIRDSSYVLSVPPPISSPTRNAENGVTGDQAARLQLVSREPSSDGQRTRFTFYGHGPDHMVLVVNGTDDGAGGKVLAWSFADQVPPTRSDCNCHFIFHSYGRPKPGYVWKFWLEIAAQESLDVAFYGQHLTLSSPQIQEYQASLPPWVSAISWLSSWSSHHFEAPKQS